MSNGDGTEQAPSPEVVLLSGLLKAINKCQKIHDDSSTSLADARALMPLIRKLQGYRRALREKAFVAAVTDSKYKAAVQAIETINNTTDDDISAHNGNLQLINNLTQAASAVLDFAIAVGATVA